MSDLLGIAVGHLYHYAATRKLLRPPGFLKQVSGWMMRRFALLSAWQPADGKRHTFTHSHIHTHTHTHPRNTHTHTHTQHHTHTHTHRFSRGRTSASCTGVSRTSCTKLKNEERWHAA